MFLLLFGFFIGFLIPAIASRFGKILPADPGNIIVDLFHKPHFPKCFHEEKGLKLKKLWKKFFLISFLWAITIASLFLLSDILFDGGFLFFACAFIYIVALLMSVDRMYFLLPDFFTIPLLVLGFTSVYLTNSPVSMTEAIIGAWYGYFVSVVSVICARLVTKNSEFGAGDAKMLTALGAWFGLMGISVVLVLSFIFFFIETRFSKTNVGPFGPALGLASLIVFFLMFFK